MKNRPAVGTPMRQQARGILLGVRIVARAPVGMIDRLLQVDQQQDGAVRRTRQFSRLMEQA
jgi:hypothetical protein